MFPYCKKIKLLANYAHRKTNAHSGSEAGMLKLVRIKLHEQRCFADTAVAKEYRLKYRMVPLALGLNVDSN